MRWFLLSALLSVSVFADSVTTQDGSVIQGKLVDYSAASVVMDTPFAGKITIERSAVKEIRSSEQRFYRLKSGNTLLGALTIGADTMSVQTANGQMNISDDTIESTWAEGAEDPAVASVKAAQRHWSYEAALDLIGKSGNSEKLAVGGRLAATLKSPEDKLYLYLSGKHAEENSNLTDKELKGGIDFERKAMDPLSWYVRLGMERDEIELLDLRSTAALGLGWYLWEEEDHELRARTGLQVKHESYRNGSNETLPGIDFGLYHRMKLAKYEIKSNVEITPAFEDFAQYTLNHESHVSVPLADSWDLRLGVSNDYNSMPPAGTDELDTGYFMHLVLKWQ